MFARKAFSLGPKADECTTRSTLELNNTLPMLNDIGKALLYIPGKRSQLTIPTYLSRNPYKVGYMHKPTPSSKVTIVSGCIEQCQDHPNHISSFAVLAYLSVTFFRGRLRLPELSLKFYTCDPDDHYPPTIRNLPPWLNGDDIFIPRLLMTDNDIIDILRK